MLQGSVIPSAPEFSAQAVRDSTCCNSIFIMHHEACLSAAAFRLHRMHSAAQGSFSCTIDTAQITQLLQCSFAFLLSALSGTGCFAESIFAVSTPAFHVKRNDCKDLHIIWPQGAVPNGVDPHVHATSSHNEAASAAERNFGLASAVVTSSTGSENGPKPMVSLCIA